MLQYGICVVIKCMHVYLACTGNMQPMYMQSVHLLQYTGPTAGLAQRTGTSGGGEGVYVGNAASARNGTLS